LSIQDRLTPNLRWPALGLQKESVVCDKQIALPGNGQGDFCLGYTLPTMNILHTHYQPPQKPEEPGGILFWMETSDLPAPKSGRAAKKEKSRRHPFCADADTLRRLLDLDSASKAVILLFGVGRIGKIAGEIGAGIRNFREAVKEDQPADEKND
jgi:hypothetical protein